jgi:hypothetical protein
MAPNRKLDKLNRRTALLIMKEIFQRNGYVRVQDPVKLKEFGHEKYKKGYEIRFMPKDNAELKLLQKAIASLGFYVSKTFLKHKRIVQPLYGKIITIDFINMLSKISKTNRRSH